MHGQVLRGRWLVLISAALLHAVPLPAAAPPEGIPADYRLLYSQDFTAPAALDELVMTDPRAWRLAPEGVPVRGSLELFQQSRYQPPHRSPVNLALVSGHVFGDFVLEAQCQQTGREYGHRDMVFVFGYQSPARYYYVHIATRTDDHANQIFIVNNAPRTKITERTNTGNNWGLNVWRRVRLERRASDGTVKVYFDDLREPIMAARDRTLGPGWVGFGSFDDTGKIAELRIWGRESAARPAPPFVR